MSKDLLSVSAEGGEVVCAELLGGSGVIGWEGVGVRVLAGKVGDGAGLRWVEVEFEPLMTLAVVVDLEAPAALRAFVAKFAGGGGVSGRDVQLGGGEPTLELCRCLRLRGHRMRRRAIE